MMQKIKKEISFILIYALVLVLFGACSDEDYFSADPISNQAAITSDTYTYLASKPEQFSSFLEVIDLTNSQELINTLNSTVIAPQNNSIKRFLEELGEEQVSDISTEILLDHLKKYVVNTKVTSVDLAEPLTAPNVYGHDLIFEIKREKWKGVDNVGPQYISVYNLKDIGDDTDDIEVKVVTPDLETTSGIVQVLAKDHLFGF